MFSSDLGGGGGGAACHYHLLNRGHFPRLSRIHFTKAIPKRHWSEAGILPAELLVSKMRQGGVGGRPGDEEWDERVQEQEGFV